MIDPVLPAASPAAGPLPVGSVEAAAAARGPAAIAISEAGIEFGAVLGQMAVSAADVVRNAEAISLAGIQGRASVQQVVEAVMNAEQTLQGAIAVRDKVVATYLELSRMQI